MKSWRATLDNGVRLIKFRKVIYYDEYRNSHLFPNVKMLKLGEVDFEGWDSEIDYNLVICKWQSVARKIRKMKYNYQIMREMGWENVYQEKKTRHCLVFRFDIDRDFGRVRIMRFVLFKAFLLVSFGVIIPVFVYIFHEMNIEEPWTALGGS